MTTIYDEYKENLKKELRKRKRVIYRDIVSIAVLAALLVVVLIYEERTHIIQLIVIGIILYLALVLYGLRKKIKVYHSYMDNLHVEKGHIVKYSSSLDKEVLRIPFNRITGVYTNIKQMHWTIYIVYDAKDGLAAESFYKTRIRDRKKFQRFVKENNLLNKDPIDIEELQDILESG